MLRYNVYRAFIPPLVVQEVVDSMYRRSQGKNAEDACKAKCGYPSPPPHAPCQPQRHHQQEHNGK